MYKTNEIYSYNSVPLFKFSYENKYKFKKKNFNITLSK